MSFTPRPYQIAASDWMSTKRRALLISPAGSGKTITVAMALDKAIKSRHRKALVKIGWLSNTKEQCQQARDAINLFPVVAKQDIRIACAASSTDWSDRDVLVGDEIHHALAPGWKSQIETCKNARWGMTATPPQDPIQMDALTELLGPSYTITREQVAANLTPAVVRWLDATDPNLKEPIDTEIDRVVKIRRKWWPGDPQQLWGQVAWQTCVEMGIVANKLRNAAAIRAAVNDKPTLVLVNQVEHGQVLAGSIPGAVACYSAMGAAARGVALENFKSGKTRCLVATKMLEEGFDAPNAEVIVMVCGGKSSRMAEQATGRVLRKFAGKSQSVVIDFRDNYHPLARKHALHRSAVYEKLGYAIERSERSVEGGPLLWDAV